MSEVEQQEMRATLTPTQSLVLHLAVKEQQRIHAQAEAIRQEGDNVVARAVLAIREDFDVPVEIPVRFENESEDGRIALVWHEPKQSPPDVPQNDPETTPHIGLELVE